MDLYVLSPPLFSIGWLCLSHAGFKPGVECLPVASRVPLSLLLGMDLLTRGPIGILVPHMHLEVTCNACILH